MLNLTVYDGTFTLVNRKTGTHRTFSIKTNQEGGRYTAGERIITLLSGPNNEEDYVPFAALKEGKVRVFKKYWDTKYEELGKFIYSLTKTPHPSVDVLFEQRCKRCFRKLTNPDSIEGRNGYGPECYAKLSQ